MIKCFKKNNGFAMLEVLIAMIIITTLLTVTMIPGMTLNNYEKRKITHQRMQTVQRAMNQYVQAFGRLPCPIDPSNATTESYAENINSNNCDASVPTFNGGSVAYGAVPAITLGIGQENVQDGWGNKIMYIVPKSLTRKPDVISPAQAPITFYRHTNNGYQIPATELVGGTIYYTNGTDFSDYLPTFYRVNNTSYIKSPKNIYVLLSYGENGLGAYSITGTQNVSAGADVSNGEDQNIFSGAKTNNAIFTNPSKTMKGGNLDDIVYEGAILDVLNTGTNIQNLVYCDYRHTPYIDAVVQPSPIPAATLDTINQRFSTTPYYAPNAEVMIQDDCPNGCVAASNGIRKYIKCIGGGNWSNVYTRSCAC